MAEINNEHLELVHKNLGLFSKNIKFKTEKETDILDFAKIIKDLYEELKDESTFDINYNLQQAYKNFKTQLDKLQKLSVIVSDALNTKKLDTTSPVYLCAKNIKNQKLL